VAEPEQGLRALVPLLMHPVSIAIISLGNGYVLGIMLSLERIQIILFIVLQFALGLWARSSEIKARKRKPDEEA